MLTKTQTAFEQLLKIQEITLPFYFESYSAIMTSAHLTIELIVFLLNFNGCIAKVYVQDMDVLRMKLFKVWHL